MNFSNIDLGPLPVNKINKCLGLLLETGSVRFKAIAQIHASERHSNDFDLCLQNIQRIVSQPDFIGRGQTKLKALNRLEGFSMTKGLFWSQSKFA